MPDSVMTETTSQDPQTATTGSFVFYVLLALGLALFIRFFIAAPYVVQGSSMEPTFENWDYLITDRISYQFTEPKRGDIVVFCLPSEEPCTLLARAQEGLWRAPRTLIKRVIGLPGETVSISAEGVRITNATATEGFFIDETYVAPTNKGGPSNVEITLGENEYFVLGDNRRVSSDSRVWGVLPREDIVGHVLLRLFPFSHIEIMPGNSNYSQGIHMTQ